MDVEVSLTEQSLEQLMRTNFFGKFGNWLVVDEESSVEADFDLFGGVCG